jgi:hypothetical protein
VEGFTIWLRPAQDALQPLDPREPARRVRQIFTALAGGGRPIILLLSEGQMSDQKGARLVLHALPPTASLIADRGYDSAWFR